MALSQPELLRHVNQEIENLWLSRLRPDDALPVVCECADPRCIALVNVTLATFQDAVERRLFLVIAGHTIHGGTIVAGGDGWELVAPPPAPN
jgi:hypothetical protein